MKNSSIVWLAVIIILAPGIDAFSLDGNNTNGIRFTGENSNSIYQSEQIPDFIQPDNQNTNIKPLLKPNYVKIPLYFIPNKGQVHEDALFYAKATGYTLWMTKNGLVFDSVRSLKPSSIKNSGNGLNPQLFEESINAAVEQNRMQRDVSELVFVNANRNPEITPINVTEHNVNYFIGNEKSRWKTNIPGSKAVLSRDIYTNIDLKVYGSGYQIECDYIVKPGGDVEHIKFEFKEIITSKIDKNGNLLITTGLGEFLHKKPFCYQVINNNIVKIKSRFQKTGIHSYGFIVENYDSDHNLIIDPVILASSTYFGGSEYDMGTSIISDISGNIYIAGATKSSDFPTLLSYQGKYAGGGFIYGDVFIAKFNKDGKRLLYSTYLGGTDNEIAYGIAVDISGNIYITGYTQSTDFPTKNAFQGAKQNVFVVKLNSTGSDLVYSTYLGGDSTEHARDITVDSSGNAYVVGFTQSSNFPTKNAYQGTSVSPLENICFITKFNPTGTDLLYSTYLGGSRNHYADAISVDSIGCAYVTGQTSSTDFPTINAFQGTYAGGYYDYEDVFVTKFNSTGLGLVYSTYLGGSDDEADLGTDIAVDGDGNAYVVGNTWSSNFPTIRAYQGSLNGSSDAFITKFNSAGSELIYSTYLGGSYDEQCTGIVLDEYGTVYITGVTVSSDFPTVNPFKGTYSGGMGWDTFFAMINLAGTNLIYSTYLGGMSHDISADLTINSDGDIYITGRTASVDFSTLNAFQGTHGGGEYDAFLAKFAIDRHVVPINSKLLFINLNFILLILYSIYIFRSISG